MIRWAKLVGLIDVSLIFVALLLAALFGSWSLAGAGAAIWWVTFFAGVVWGIALVGNGGVRELNIFERNGVVAPGELSRMLQPQRWNETVERVALGAVVFVPLGLVAWVVSLLG